MRRKPLLAILVPLLCWAIGFGLLVWHERPDGKFHFWALDVGQGDSLLMTTAHGDQILVDGGPTDQVLPQLGRHMPFWDRKIELVILTHNHADHLTGLLAVLQRYQVGQVWISGAVYTTPEYRAWTKLLAERHIPTRIVWAGQHGGIDNVKLDVLFPLTDQTGILPENQHDSTVVVRAAVEQTKLLLTGDLEETHERAILDHFCRTTVPATPCPALEADILKVPHHGSKTGLIPEFLAAIHPRAAIISVGLHNSYGHPSPVTIDRLAAAHVPTYRTDQNGTVEVRISPLRVVPERPSPVDQSG